MVNPDHNELVKRFAAALGWNGIQGYNIILDETNCGTSSPGTTVTGWSTTDLKHFIQINQSRTGSFGQYNVSVVAERFHIGPMPFQKCSFHNYPEADGEANRLSATFHRKNFYKKSWRREFLQQHPELLFGRKKWRGWKGRLGQ